MGAAFPPENHPQSVKMAEVPPFFFSPLGRQVYGQWGPLSAVLEKATQNFFLPCFPNKILLSSCNCLFRETVSTIFCGLCNHTLYWPLFTISISKDLLKYPFLSWFHIVDTGYSMPWIFIFYNDLLLKSWRLYWWTECSFMLIEPYIFLFHILGAPGLSFLQPLGRSVSFFQYRTFKE